MNKINIIFTFMFSIAGFSAVQAMQEANPAEIEYPSRELFETDEIEETYTDVEPQSPLRRWFYDKLGKIKDQLNERDPLKEKLEAKTAAVREIKLNPRQYPNAAKKIQELERDIKLLTSKIHQRDAEIEKAASDRAKEWQGF
jgi:predicted RNase H-like nuclease (RuvC/YqgF family)